MRYEHDQRGSLLILTIVATGLFLVVAMGAISLAILQEKRNVQQVASAQALYIAEAGVNYYRWVLYHRATEYCNNETCRPAPNYGPYGPYSYTSQDGSIRGHYQLYITPPAINGSTIVKIRSVGWVEGRENTKRTIEVQCGIPAWSTYTTLVDDVLSYGTDAEVWGPVHSNTQIAFDGIAHNLISAYQLYRNYGGFNEWGVFTHRGTDDPHYSTPPNNRPDVFIGGRIYGPANVQQISFDKLDNFANTIYGLATSSGLVFDPRNNGVADPTSRPAWRGCINSGGNCDEGFQITLLPNDRFTIRGVTSVIATCNGQPSWSTSTVSALSETYTIPSNGVIFVKNNVWVDGVLNNGATGTRATIVAFTHNFADDNNTNIIINNGIRYSLLNGYDSIGLIAQRDILFGLRCNNNMYVDAALIAVNGRRRRIDYSGASTCSGYRTRNYIKIYGSTASNDTPYLSPGFDNRDYVYDPNLTYSPPPHYPTTGEYTFISWEEK